MLPLSVTTDMSTACLHPGDWNPDRNLSVVEGFFSARSLTIHPGSCQSNVSWNPHHLVLNQFSMCANRSTGQWAAVMSQHHREVGFRREGWRSPSSIPLLEQGHLEQVAQGNILTDSDYLQGRDLQNLNGQLVPVICHHQSKEIVLFRWNCVHLKQVYACCPLLLGTTEKSLALHSCPNITYLRFPLRCLFFS